MCHKAVPRKFNSNFKLNVDTYYVPIDQSLDEAANSFNASNEQHGDEWDADLEALPDDESDQEQSNEQ